MPFIVDPVATDHYQRNTNAAKEKPEYTKRESALRKVLYYNRTPNVELRAAQPGIRLCEKWAARLGISGIAVVSCTHSRYVY